jgi:hypothetical protein
MIFARESHVDLMQTDHEVLVHVSHPSRYTDGVTDLTAEQSEFDFRFVAQCLNQPSHGVIVYSLL